MSPYDAIQREVASQDHKWGEQNHPDLYWLGILMEEVGEVAQSCIEPSSPVLLAERRREVEQVAAVCVNWLRCMDRR